MSFTPAAVYSLVVTEVTALFSPREGEGQGAILPLYEGAEIRLPRLCLPPMLEEQLPQTVERTVLLAALLRGGAIRADQIRLET